MVRYQSLVHQEVPVEAKSLIAPLSYAIVSDGNNRFLIAKFRNMMDESCHDLRFQIAEFDAAGNPCGNLEFSYRNFFARAHRVFTSQKPIKLSALTASVTFRLVYASFDNIALVEGAVFPRHESQDTRLLKGRKQPARVSIAKEKPASSPLVFAGVIITLGADILALCLLMYNLIVLGGGKLLKIALIFLEKGGF
jgi:hypothetical protein